MRVTELECCSSNERPPSPSGVVWLWNFKHKITLGQMLLKCWNFFNSNQEHNSRIKIILITELCSIPKKSGIVLNSLELSSRDFGFHWEQSTIPGGIVDENWAQGTELWLGIELKGKFTAPLSWCIYGNHSGLLWKERKSHDHKGRELCSIPQWKPSLNGSDISSDILRDSITSAVLRHLIGPFRCFLSRPNFHSNIVATTASDWLP